MKKNNLIKDKTYAFALDIIRLYVELRKQKEFVLSKQLLRSGTSIGANVEEATAAKKSSKAILDFEFLVLNEMKYKKTSND